MRSICLSICFLFVLVANAQTISANDVQERINSYIEDVSANSDDGANQTMSSFYAMLKSDNISFSEKYMFLASFFQGSEKVINIGKYIQQYYSQQYGPNSEESQHMIRAIVGDYIGSQKVEEAVAYCRDMKESLKKFGNLSDEYLTSVCNLATCYMVVHDYDNAEKYYDETLDLIHQKNWVDENDKISYLIGIAEAFYSVGKYEKAIDVLNDAESNYRILKSNRDESLHIKLLEQLTACVGDMGNVEDALNLNEQAINETKKLYGKDITKYIYTLLNRALLLTQNGQQIEALNVTNIIEESLDKFDEEQRPTIEAFMNMRKSIAYGGLGRFR